MAKPSPTLDLPIQYQTLTVDVEPVALLRNFGPDSYDVANMTAVVSVNSSGNDYRLVLPFATEDKTRAFVRVVSATDRNFDIVKRFTKFQGKLEEALPLLKKAGWVPQDAESVPPELIPVVKGFCEATISIPAGQQLLRIHASKKLEPTDESRRAYSLVLFAPLLNFILGGGQTNLSVNVVLPPNFQAGNLQLDSVSVVPLPGQTEPALASGSDQPVQVADNRVLGWHWRNDPKVTINYRYN